MKRFIYTIGLVLLWQSYLAAVPVPDTGQTTSYTDTFGEDADYTRIPPSYTKLDPDGSGGITELPDTATSWAMVRDNVTGLIWEVKTDDGSLNDKDDTYTWQNAQDVFVQGLNTASFCDFSDWRLPSARELKSIVDYNENTPSVNQAYFSNTTGGYYWSSVDSAADGNSAWCVRFDRGHMPIKTKTSTNYYARAVRGTQQDSNNFVDNGNGTVSDLSTGLMWQQATAGPLNWEAALGYSEGLILNIDGEWTEDNITNASGSKYDDWRLPNTNELHSIVEFVNVGPAIDTIIFPGTESSQYWSSTSYDYYSSSAWYVHFDDGVVSSYNKSLDSSAYYVRAVRNGNVEYITVGEDTIILESEPGTTLLNCQSVATPSGAPDDIAGFPYGLFEFTIYGVEPGGSTTLTITLPDGASPSSYYKYDSALDPQWYKFMYDGTTGAEIDGNVITLHFVDGGTGDSDLTADGVIIDPSGPVLEKNVAMIQVGEEDIWLKSESGTTLSNCEAVSTPADPPTDTSFPYGLLAYEISGVPSESVTLGTTTLEITLPAGANPTSYYQYGPTSDEPLTDHWYEDTGAEINGNVITLTLVDGGWGDSDLTDDEVILVDSPRGSGPALEANAASISSLDGNDTILLESPLGTTLNNVQAIDNPSPSDTPADAEFPYGVFTFEISGVPSGSITLGSATLEITLPTGATPTSYYKYGPEKDVDETDHWYEFMYDEVTGTGAEINGNFITLYLGDGARGDSDLLDNGIIIDPGAPVFRSSSNNTPGTSGGDDDDDATPYASSDGGGGGGCFIDSLIE